MQCMQVRASFVVLSLTSPRKADFIQLNIFFEKDTSLPVPTCLLVVWCVWNETVRSFLTSATVVIKHQRWQQSTTAAPCQCSVSSTNLITIIIFIFRVFYIRSSPFNSAIKPFALLNFFVFVKWICDVKQYMSVCVVYLKNYCCHCCCSLADSDSFEFVEKKKKDGSWFFLV